MTYASQIIEEHNPDMLIFGMSFDCYDGTQMYQRLEFYYDVEGEVQTAELDAVFS